jgi:ABC-type glycerol-3-phosphate transport system permease component
MSEDTTAWTGSSEQARARERRVPRRRRIPWGGIVKHAVLIGFCLSILLPLLWVLLLSIKSIPSGYQNQIWPPHGFDFAHYLFVWETIGTLPRNMLNSVVVTLGSVAITTVCAVLGGYDGRAPWVSRLARHTP